jgi:hypothetical protein
MKAHGVLEIAIFKVKAEEVANMPALRAGLREALKSFPGLIDYQAYRPIEADSFADIAWWENLECAQAAAKAFERGDVRFLPYMQAIEELSFMGHFRPEASPSL